MPKKRQIEFTPTAGNFDLLPGSIFGSEAIFLRAHGWDLVREALVRLSSISKRPEFYRFINVGLQYESILDFAEGSDCEQFMSELEDVIARLNVSIFTILFLQSVQRLLSRSWLCKPAKRRASELWAEL